MELKIGSSGEDVKKVQKFLKLTVDGDFGKVSYTAVKVWQECKGLPGTGVVDKKTWDKMFPVIEQVKTPSVPIVHTAKPLFNIDGLKKHIPEKVLSQIPQVMTLFNITNKLRLAHFLSQCGHESGGFALTVENLNYSAKGLAGTFPSRFAKNPNAKVKEPNQLALSIERNPEKIANNVYSDRMGNGPASSGDGWKFRGRGYIQLTGKNNYTTFDKTVDENILDFPDLVATKYPLASAAFFFDSNKLWSICDKGADDETVTLVTKRVNGGTIGLSDRIKHFKEYYNALK